MLKTIRDKIYNSTTTSALGGIISVLFIRVLGILFLFGITIYLTNFYDPALVGAYEFTRSALFLIGGFAILGTDQSILFFSGRFLKRNQVKTFFRIYLKMVLLILLISGVILIGTLAVPQPVFDSLFNDSTSGTLLVKTSFCVFFYAITLLNTELYRGFALQKKSELYRGLYKQLPFAVGLFVLYMFEEKTYLVDVFLASYLVLAIITSLEVLKIYSRNTTSSNSPSKPVSFKTILKSTMPIAMSALGFYLLISIDIFFLKIYTDFKTLAYYGTAVKIIFLISTIVSTISSYIAVEIAELYVKNREELQALMRKGVRIISLLSVLLSVFLYFFSELILNIFGAEYTEANESLRILIIGHFLSTLCGITAVYLNMTKKQITLQYIIAFTVVFNGILNWVLIPKMGMNGAAIASALSVVMWNVIAGIIIYRKDKINLFIH